jgi:hypothetical protein
MDTKADRYGYLRKTGAIGVSTKAIAVSGSTRGKGSLGSASVETKGLAKRAKIEGNESAMYEKLEKRSLRGLKGGGTEKELRAGHNERGGMKTPYNAATNPIRATRQKNRRDVFAAKRAGEDVSAVRKQNRADMRMAKEVRQTRNKMGLRKSDRMMGRMAREAAAGKTVTVTPTKKSMPHRRKGLAGLV